ncbi:MAG: LysM peptidoglycan-binding domain-containing protein [Sporocytophaga sp.]|uniref:LysM peptidoglycan-binding domain-containing protein n=1 Tax=Sporocytophaga sp. TaxID=2231183 RepID=UPI001B01D196|nr:LysM peptidoglycan-binding domain-containing protein [Sporocytophaga sp.]MBO9700306.1 LysM peptidoglycan-binding domain-containing protein [Sporocytophaga sp.]
MNYKAVSLLKYFLVLILFISLSNVFAGIQDSIGVEKKDSKVFVLHKADPKETLYSISRKYKVTVDELNKSNPELSAGLKVGQVLRIPYKGSVVAVSHAAETSSSASSGSAAGTHTVEPKETLYSLSRKYNVSVEEIKKANPGLTDLKVGQTINIPGKSGAVSTASASKEAPRSEAKKDEPKASATSTQKAVTKNNKSQEQVFVPPTDNFNKVTESGFAEVIEGNNDSPKYLALHKTAPIGTIIQVKNEANGQKLFVRVIGKLQNGNVEDKVIIKISQKAYERLSGVDKKIPVQISYIP